MSCFGGIMNTRRGRVGTIITCSYFIIFFLFFMHSVGLFAVVSPDLHLQAHMYSLHSHVRTTCSFTDFHDMHSTSSFSAVILFRVGALSLSLAIRVESGSG